ncbi:hypothetical protein [Acinetobacter sp. ANC 3791]|uniref:hypothetical protein n=1 Tax=Acinetobacter sp. ANC 3791 TaxID=2529836 RepID=UPI00103DF1F8|nr:hypothetical protein [Acinetobacter sp. ANC 3791]TCB86290.1 hypothetical protein E0H90_00230 [Acinetobacter sp. ANC 3791]
MTTWIKIQTDNLNKVPNLDSFEFNEDGLFLYCDFDGVQKTLFFENFFSMRMIDEGNALKMMAGQPLDGIGWLFINNESDLSTWFNDTSFDIHKDEYKSYVVAALFHIVEVLSNKPPAILDNTN